MIYRRWFSEELIHHFGTVKETVCEASLDFSFIALSPSVKEQLSEYIRKSSSL